MVSTWMPNGTLSNYIEGETGLLQPSRTKLVSTPHVVTLSPVYND